MDEPEHTDVIVIGMGPGGQGQDALRKPGRS